ncbi:YqeG family HAD IIIA-type phosphatase [Coprothermobacter platensis]|uniref:YqeG family HAD IIIA-type phosphatase n=1 Tax=Coprothermobacter platensis TaxID=108819 RepID=UPI0003650834|nr:YqeG family HAD IIIA-type phosphatase [Coprothermobacter platensis]
MGAKTLQIDLKEIAYFHRVSDISIDFLKEEGIDGLVVDVDNTIMPYDVDAVPDDIASWLNTAKCILPIVIISNTKPYRAKIIRESLGIPAYGMCLKPVPFSLYVLRNHLKNAKNVAMVGDQLFTDGLYAKWNHLKFIRVEPLSPKDAPHTKFTRWLEKIIFSGAEPLDK